MVIRISVGIRQVAADSFGTVYDRSAADSNDTVGTEFTRRCGDFRDLFDCRVFSDIVYDLVSASFFVKSVCYIFKCNIFMSLDKVTGENKNFFAA